MSLWHFEMNKILMPSKVIGRDLNARTPLQVLFVYLQVTLNGADLAKDAWIAWA
jgi:hypothetical protein